uniref:Uncharacterized protein n=1 Tax=Rhizophora mucronata TaxID=61149 RepID=A0A2P2N8B0_RHIMU
MIDLCIDGHVYMKCLLDFGQFMWIIMFVKGGEGFNFSITY